MTDIRSLFELAFSRFDRPDVLKKLAAASRQLAELKGVAAAIPHQGILINALGMQEAKESSAIENIVTTHDELYRDDAAGGAEPASAAAKEVRRYRQALWVGFRQVQATGLITNNDIVAIQSELVQITAGFRKLPGTTLKDGAGRTVYTPPQDPATVVRLMGDLERFINDSDAVTLDPLIKMALLHHQFETIHPFYDGNGRTGRILNVLYLVQQGLLDIPVLYLSRYIVRTKSDYYRLLQSVRENDSWEEWVLYLLTGIEQSARDGMLTVQKIKAALLDSKRRLRAEHKFYSQDLINHLYSHPYTKIEHLQRDLKVSRITARKYLEVLAASGLLSKQRIGKSNYYVNIALNSILTSAWTGA